LNSGLDADVDITELRRVQEFVQGKLPNRICRWEGKVRVEMLADTYGAKASTCEIVLDRGVMLAEIRWPVYLHEMLHAFSEGGDDAAYAEFRRWEEGAVEKLERLWRSSMFIDLGLSLSQATQDEIAYNDEINPYNAYIASLERIRRLLQYESEQDFYCWLLSVPMSGRAGAVMKNAREMAQRHNYDVIKRKNLLVDISQACEELREEREEE
jgi:hypothetical protein